MRLILLFIVVSLLSCKPQNKSVKRTEVKVFGDSLRIEYTYIGDTVYQKRTDLRIKNGFNNSYQVRSVWKTKTASNLNCNDSISLSKDRMNYIFCLEDVEKLKSVSPNDKLQHIDTNDLSNTSYKTIFYYLSHLDYAVFDTKTKTKVVKTRIEHYETPFSSGHIYYMMNTKNDTIGRYHINDWMR